MAGTDHHDDDTPTLPSEPGRGSSDVLRKAFDRAAGSDSHDEAEPEQIGHYRVLGRVGRGGMGSVYKATDTRENSAQRTVAIKLIRKGLDTEDVLKRFKLEGQLLAALNHPNIARLYEVAETDDGQPFFVMEYIDGKPLDKYCDENTLAIRGRLDIFRKVCAAVHHAHTNLIVHRDLKPGNILVTPEGEPKLLDFGIAKLLNPALGRVEVLTRPTMRIMTPEYASPEQVSGATVGTQSDVYSLGVLLYELLCGRRPYQFAKRIEAEVVRVICESMPMRPSTAISRSDDGKPQTGTTASLTPETIAQSRSTDRIESLRRSLSGDLDDIVMMAMAKSAARRYASADHFSRDLERYLGGLPVEARKTGSRALYEARKFLRRHRAEVASAALVVLVVVIGSTATALQWRTASIANANAATALEEQLVAEQELSVASAYGDALWLRANTELTFIMTPLERRKFWDGVQEDFAKLSERFDADDTQAQLAKSRALLQAGNAMGGIRSGNMGEFDLAFMAYTQARDSLLELYRLEPDNVVIWSEAVEAQLRIADMMRRTNQIGGALDAYEQAITLAERGAFPDGGLRVERQRAKPQMALGQTSVLLGDAAKAASIFAEQEEERRTRASEYSTSLTAQRDLSVVLLNFGELAHLMADESLARQKLDESLSIRRDLLTKRPEHVSLRRDVAVGLLMLSVVNVDNGKATAAKAQIDEAVEILAELAAEAPDDARIPMTAASALIEYATACARASENEAAHSSAAIAREEINRLETLAPQHPQLNTLRARRRLIEAQIDLSENDLPAAAEGFELARDQLSLIATADPANAMVRVWNGDALAGLGESRRRQAAASSDEELAVAAAATFSEARRAYANCGEPGKAFGPSEHWWRIVNAQPR